MLNDTRFLIYKQCHIEIGQNQYIEMLSNVSHIARVVDILWTANFDFKRVENQFQDNKLNFQPGCRQMLMILSNSILANRYVVVLLPNYPIMSATLIKSLRKLEHQIMSSSGLFNF